MVYRGLVRGGVVIFDGVVELPEGTTVSVEAVPAPQATAGTMAGDHFEKIDRHLGSLRHSGDEGTQAQQHDRFL